MRITKKISVFLTFVLCNCLTTSLQDEESDAWKFTNEILTWSQTGYESELFEHYITELAFPIQLRNTDLRSLTGSGASAACTLCKSTLKTAVSMYQNGSSIEKIKGIIVRLCILMHVEVEAVCRGVIESQLPIIFYIVDLDPNFDVNDACGIALQSEFCATTNEKYDWTIQIDKNPPIRMLPFESQETMKIVQITDIHYDPLYEPNGNPHCDEPMCCRKEQNVTNYSGDVAGYWGDYNDCDTPWHAVVDVLEHVNSTHQGITYIYFTGDLIDHGIWNTSTKGNIESIVKSYDKIKEIFPNTPMYPIIGNHEPHPLNIFAPSYIQEENFSTQWLYKLSADLWIQYGWLPESTRQTILQGGFYTLSPRKGHRIIALNNNVCYTLNWWLVLEPKDPDGQLRWLADTLSEAEKSGEYVHILAHIPSGDRSCYNAWDAAFRKIVNRFAHIISAQFNGHTHFDEFNVYYDLQNSSRPVNVAWNGGSVTTFSNLNPNYKVYTVDTRTFGIVDIDTWIFNLTAANTTPEKPPKWYKSYSFKEEYGLSDLSAASLHKWIVNASTNYTLLERYRRNFYKHADPSIRSDCDEECLRNLLCNVVLSSTQKEECEFFMT